MNITELIVDFVKEGNVVEFPGMGTLTCNSVSARHDAETGTFFPARRTVVMNDSQAGNKSIIRRIADSECVTTDIAEQLWANYVAALDDKLRRCPAGHEFPGIGMMRRVGTKVTFDALEGLDLDAGKHHEQPLENVSTYIPKEVDDPFAKFDKPAEPEPVVAPAPVVEPVSVPEPEVKPEPIVVPEPIVKPEPVAKPEPVVEQPTPIVEPERPAPAQPVEERPTNPVVEPVVVPMMDKTEKVAEAVAPAAAVAATAAAAAMAEDHFSEVKRQLAEIPSSITDPKEVRRAEKAAAKAEKEARKAAEKMEKVAAKKEKEAAKLAANEADMERKRVEKAAKHKQKEEKKKSHAWLWILILLLLLAAAAYYYFTQVRGSKSMASSSAPVGEWEFTYKDQFTGSLPLLSFEENDIRNNVENVHNYMADYIKTFLTARHYSNAFAPVMHEVDLYANDRLHELMVEGYSPKRFIPYEDFWMNQHFDEYKDMGAYIYRGQVQGELMDMDFLDKLLDDVVAGLGLHADGYGYAGMGGGNVGGTGAGRNAVKNDKPYEEVVPEAPTFRNSKQGYDIIAGFFTSKKSANKCANQLKNLGSDAYIINKAGGYYVSMGSAPTYTAAESMMKHIKSWYKSDVTIKNFNE